TEALDLFRQINADQPNSPEILNNLGVLLARQGQLDEAAATLRSALEREPTYRLALENLGDVHVRMAVSAYERLLQLSNDNPAAAAKLRWVSALALPSTAATTQGIAPGRAGAASVLPPGSIGAMGATGASAAAASAAASAKPPSGQSMRPSRSPSVVMPNPVPAKPAQRPADSAAEKKKKAEEARRKERERERQKEQQREQQKDKEKARASDKSN
ncbi:MAG: hypothetical protein EBS99_14790, partial [Betaproteobacteria bacterium]|nr:hypothetical protein [Betaproteobacteria bacterium]